MASKSSLSNSEAEAKSKDVQPSLCNEKTSSYSTTTIARETKARNMLGISSEHRLRNENLPFDIDVWYPALAEFTFPTIFLPLQRSEAQAILNFYQTHQMARKGRLTMADVSTLERLEDTLDELIKTHFGHTGAFLRLCGRSPKDGDALDRTGLVNSPPTPSL